MPDSGREFTSHQRGIVNRYYDHKDTIMLQKLGEIVSDLYVATDAKKIERLWGSAKIALTNLQVDPRKMADAMRAKDVPALAKLVNELAANVPKADAAKTSDSGATTLEGAGPEKSRVEPGGGGAGEDAPARLHNKADATDPETLKHAMKAFRKRLKLTALDQESKLGRNPMSGGKHANIVAMVPPNEYPRAVWEELVKQGKLRSAGGGFYQLAESA